MVPPYIDEYWRGWQADKPKRYRAIIASAEFAVSVGVRIDFFPQHRLARGDSAASGCFRSPAPAREVGQGLGNRLSPQTCRVGRALYQLGAGVEEDFQRWKRGHADD